MRSLDPKSCRRILVRGTNWVGDAVMTLPTLEALAFICPQANIHVLAKPWVAAVYEASPHVARVVEYDAKGNHHGIRGILGLAGELSRTGYDWALLLQNALEAALIARLAKIPVRLGYAADGRRLLLSHPVARDRAVRSIHETSYYLSILAQLGLLEHDPPADGVIPRLLLKDHDRRWAEEFLASRRTGGPVLGLAPGAAFGPAKCWPADRFAAAARELMARGMGGVLLFGSKGEAAQCADVAAGLGDLPVWNLAGQTSLGQAMALLARLGLFLTNDSGLMHAAAALGTPTVAVFGSTNPVTTSPKGERVCLVRRAVDCSPCLKQVCPRDLRCFTTIEPGEVVEAGANLLTRAGEAGTNG